MQNFPIIIIHACLICRKFWLKLTHYGQKFHLFKQIFLIIILGQPLISFAQKHHHSVSHSTHLTRSHAHSKVKKLHSSVPHKKKTKSEKNHHTASLKKTKSKSINPPKKLAKKTQTGPIQFASNIASKITGFVAYVINRQTSNHYKLGGNYFNPHKGVYNIDCSAYVDHLLSHACPIAYKNVKHWTNSEKPTSYDYYAFFNNLPDNEVWRNWSRVPSVSSLRAGDILVFHKKNNKPGHVMVVTNTPMPFRGLYNAFSVRVSDSAPSGHSNDTRPPHTSGVGIGTLLLRVNVRTGEPYAYAWKLGSSWKYDIDFAMARPAGPHRG